MTAKEKHRHESRVKTARDKRRLEKEAKLKLQAKIENNKDCGPNSYCGECKKCVELDEWLKKDKRRMPWPEKRENKDVSITSSWIGVEEYLRKFYTPGLRELERRIPGFFYGHSNLHLSQKGGKK